MKLKSLPKLVFGFLRLAHRNVFIKTISEGKKKKKALLNILEHEPCEVFWRCSANISFKAVRRLLKTSLFLKILVSVEQDFIFQQLSDR